MARMVSVHCYKCYGSGMIRKRNQIGMIHFTNCKHCYLGRRWVQEGSGEHRLSANIGAMGLYKGITKHQNDRGWNRR